MRHTDPAEPKYESAKANERDVMGPEIGELALSTAAEDKGVRETADSGAKFDRSSTGIVQHSPFLMWKSVSTLGEA